VQIISAAVQNNIPAVYWQSAFARDAGLLSYGVDLVDTFHRTALRESILRGAKPAELPSFGNDLDCGRASARECEDFY